MFKTRRLFQQTPCYSLTGHGVSGGSIAASAPFVCFCFSAIFLSEEVEVAGQKLRLQSSQMCTGSSGAWELTQSSCPPQSFLPLLACGFQPCHSTFYQGIHKESNLFYLIKPHLKDNLSATFRSSLVLELADGVRASDIGSFSASPFHNPTLHLIRQRCLEAPT